MFQTDQSLALFFTGKFTPVYDNDISVGASFKKTCIDNCQKLKTWIELEQLHKKFK